MFCHFFILALALLCSDLECIAAIITQLNDVREARAAAWAVVHDVPDILGLAMSILPALKLGTISRSQAAARVVASGLVLPAIAAAARSYPGTAAIIEQLSPFLRKAGFADADVAGK